MNSVRSYIGFGANLGDPPTMYQQTGAALQALPQTTLLAASALFRSAPVGCETAQPDYYNGVFCLHTTLDALRLLDHLLALERAAGRQRPANAAGAQARTLDLDILLYGEHIIANERLQVPHPRLHERAFALAPLLELAPDLRIPGQTASLATLLAHNAGQKISRFTPTGAIRNTIIATAI